MTVICPEDRTIILPTTCTVFSHLFFSILFDSINHSHVHMYISCWGPEEQSPSLEINFDSTNLACLCPAHLAGRGAHLTKEVETGEPTQSLSSLPHPVLVLICATDLAIP